MASIERNYYYICLRFGQDEDFSIDRTKLEPHDLIRAAYKLGLPFSHDEAMRCLFSIIEQACNDVKFVPSGVYVYFSGGSDRFTRFSTENITILKYAYYYVSKMEMTSVIANIDAWINKVNDVLNADAEWIGLNQKVMNDRDFNDCAETIVKRIILQLIPNKYRNKLIKSSTNGKDEALDTLINTFDLEPSDMPF